jgi:hypothetical protein
LSLRKSWEWMDEMRSEDHHGTHRQNRYVTAVIVLAGVFHVGFGAWAFIAPRSFYEVIATYPPYNAHFMHDKGAFMLGIGATLLAALVWQDAKAVALLGGSVAAVVHWLAHIIDREVGGATSNLWALGAFALLLVVALALRLRALSTPPAGAKVKTRLL